MTFTEKINENKSRKCDGKTEINAMNIAEDSPIVRFFERIVTPQSQIIGIFVLSIIAGLIALQPYWKYHDLEKNIPVIPITPAKITQWGNVPTRVTVGLFINNFPTLDFVNNDFVFDGIIWFEFDPALISLNTVSKFSFEKGEILSLSEPYNQFVEKKFFARYNLRVRFKSDLNYKLFPFDDHRLDIILVNRAIDPSEMIFRSYSSFFDISPSVQFSGWRLEDLLVKTGFTESTIERSGTQKIISQPRAVFSLYLRRQGSRNIFLIFLPLFVIYIISLFSFAFDPQKNSTLIFGLASAGVTSLLGYRFVIENMTPKVGYFVLSDRIFILLLLAALGEFIFAVILVRGGKLTPIMSVIRGLTYLLINVMFLTAWYYFLTQF